MEAVQVQLHHSASEVVETEAVEETAVKAVEF